MINFDKIFLDSRSRSILDEISSGMVIHLDEYAAKWLLHFDLITPYPLSSRGNEYVITDTGLLYKQYLDDTIAQINRREKQERFRTWFGNHFLKSDCPCCPYHFNIEMIRATADKIIAGMHIHHFGSISSPPLTPPTRSSTPLNHPGVNIDPWVVFLQFDGSPTEVPQGQSLVPPMGQTQQEFLFLPQQFHPLSAPGLDSLIEDIATFFSSFFKSLNVTF